MKFQSFVKIVIFLIISLFLVSCGGSDDVIRTESKIAAIEAEIGAITEIDCPLKLAGEVEGETYSCGIYTVPVDYANPDGDSLNLTYIILHATGDPLPDPIVYLAGGPGQSGVVSANDSIYGDLRQNRDLIFPAQRGTLYSERLALDECVNDIKDQVSKTELNAFVEKVSSQEKPDASLPYAEYLAQYSVITGEINSQCHQAFANAGLDPTQFNTANSTNDLVGLVEALGYESFNLHGTSYGTRLALETLRRHPEANVRSVVLDSPAAPSVERLTSLVSATHGMVLRLFDDCATDAACADAYPNLTERTADLLASLADNPLVAGDLTIGAHEVVAQLSDLPNTRADYIPRMITELEAGETATYLALLNGEVGAESPEGSPNSPTVDQLLQQISAAGATADNPFAGLQIVTDVLTSASEDDPYVAMKAVAQDQLADSDSLPQILESIDQLTSDDLQNLRAMMSGPQVEVDQAEADLRTEAIAKNNAGFLLTGIVCFEEIAFEDTDAAARLKESLAIPALVASDVLLATEVGNCTNYSMGDPDPSYNAPLSSPVPVLILQGEFDVRTPLQNGLALAEQLENATLVIVPQQGHEAWVAGSCVSQIGISFLRDPQQTLDLTCLEERQERFSLPGEPLTQETE